MADSMPGAPMGTAPKGGSAKLIIGIVVVLVLIVAGYFIFFGSGGQPPTGTTNQPAAGTNQPANGNQPTPPAATQPKEVFSYIGDVKSVGGDSITITAKATLNGLAADTTVTAKVNDSTAIIRRSIPKVLPKEGGTNLFKQETIKLSDIKVGDQVTAISATNVKGITSFTASRIEVLNVQ